MSIRIFISRNLDADSPIKSVELSHQGLVIGESMIRIEPIEISSLPTADWFFFYSKNGVDIFARKWEEKWQSTMHSPILWGAIGQGTAEVMNGWGITCDFIGRGSTEDIAEQFLEHCKPTDSVLFFRAYHSRDQLHEIVGQHRETTSIPIYDNQMIKKTFDPVDIGIFTSSRNAIAFLKHNPLPSMACIAIGQPTAATLRSLQVPESKIRVASEPSEEAVYLALMEAIGERME